MFCLSLDLVSSPWTYKHSGLAILKCFDILEWGRYASVCLTSYVAQAGLELPVYLRMIVGLPDPPTSSSQAGITDVGNSVWSSVVVGNLAQGLV